MSTSRPRIVFMGTPEFAIASLKALADDGMDIAAVVTAPDKPAGRGKKLTPPAIKEFSLSNLQCPVLQPPNLKDPSVAETLEKLGADIFAVVAFRMLPESIWSIPPRGTINLHASLLPQYRGAAPIQHAIINGEKITGVTTFLIDREIDTGRILLQEETPIAPDDDAGTLHDKLMWKGAELLKKTIRKVMEGSVDPVPQDQLAAATLPLKKAPKLFREDCHINWDMPTDRVYDLIRGLSPYPAAFGYLEKKDGSTTQIKIFETRAVHEAHTMDPGTLSSDGRHFLNIYTSDGYLRVISIQQEGRKKMGITEFLRGINTDVNGCRVK